MADNFIKKDKEIFLKFKNTFEAPFPSYLQ